MWSIDFFDNITANFFLTNNISDDLVSFLADLKMNFSSRVLEQACGTGYISNELSLKLKSRFTGIDIIPEYIEAAKTHNKQIQKLNNFIVEDITNCNFIGLYHFVINLNTSCNYFKEDEKNILFFKHAFKNLKNNGLYILETYNSNFIENNFKPLRIEEKFIKNEKFILEKKSSIENKMLKTEVKVYKNDNIIKSTFGETKLYSPKEMEKMLLDVGFKEINIYANLKKETFDIFNSPRIVFVSKK
jgi:SAM-dependent methyltransferase